MCGICGIIDFKSGVINKELITLMQDTLRHRGPDGEGIFINQGSGVKGQKWPPMVALGHRRLSIIDLKTGDQPMFNEDKSVAVVYNGEIYNFSELKKKLIIKGHRFKTKSDTEVILHQYEEDGWECAKRFNGIFAFALWDDKKKTLILARDRVGTKPLYYFYDEKRLIFASEIKAILNTLTEKPVIDTSSLFRYLILQYIPAPATLYKNIYKLLPASVLILNRKGFEIKQYWNVKEDRSQKSEYRIQNWDDEKTVCERLLKTIDESVKSQLISDVPLGAFLSGGIDSSTIVALMSKRMKSPVKTFSVGFETTDPYYNELNYARLASKYFKTEHHEIVVRPEDVINLFPMIIKYLDDPINDPAVLPTYMVSKLARDYVKVVLSGEGADELFGGYLRYSFDRFARYYQVIPELIRNGLIKPALDDIIDNKRILQGLTALSEPDLSGRYLKWVSVFDIDSLKAILGNPVFIEDEWSKLKKFYKLIHEEYNPPISPFSKGGQKGDLKKGGEGGLFTKGEMGGFGLNPILYTDIKTWLSDDLLTKVDRMSMANGLEARVPYLDNRMVDFAMSVPSWLKIKGLKRKYIFKKAVSNILPDEIIKRAKRGFALPISHWFRNELKDFVLERLSDDSVKKMDFLSPSAVNKIINEHIKGNEENSLQIWGLLTLQFLFEENKR